MGKITVKNNKKICRKCLISKDISLFGFTKDDRFNKKYIDSRCKECRKKDTYIWRNKNRGKSREISRRCGAKLRLETVSIYGKNGKPICVNCGFDDIRTLCIDHIFNNGNDERRKLGSKYFAGATFYRWLKKNNYPAGYQTLCANCNLIKEIERRKSNWL